MNVINDPTLSADQLLDLARPNVRRLADAIWALDSARSMLAKAKAGYRASPTLGDGSWDLDTYGRRVEVATIGLANLCREMRLAPIPQDVTPLQRHLDAATAPAPPRGGPFVTQKSAEELADGGVHRVLG